MLAQNDPKGALGRLDMAQTDCQTAQEAGEKAATLLQSARNLEKLKKTAASLDYYRRIVRDYPDSLQARIASERIELLFGQPVAPCMFRA